MGTLFKFFIGNPSGGTVSSPIEAFSVDEQVDVEHDQQSDAAFNHDANSMSTKSFGSYLLECAKVLFQLGLVEGRVIVDELLSIFQRTEVDFLLFLNC